jgi:predicted lipid-binding transport protein (Tim44 family)
MRTKNAMWLSLVAAALIALAPTLADARAGSGRSSGSRGDRSFAAPPSTQTAPNATKPMERSTAPTTAQRQAQPTPAAAQGGFFQRNPFLGGLLAGVVGAGLIGALMGSGFFGAGMAGMLGMLLQIALIGGVIYLAYRFWKSRQQPKTDEPAYAYTGNQGQAQQQPATYNDPMQRTGSGIPPVQPLDLDGGRGGSGPLAPPARSAERSDELGIRDTDYQEFEGLLVDVQAAYSKGDVGKLRQLATPEMAGYFAEDLSANASKGIENHIADVRLEQGDLAEAWREGNLEYATVAMRISMLDYATKDGRVVEGSDKDRVEATEIWTMSRTRGGRWILSAIQQTV